MSQLRIRRVVSGHDEMGNAVIANDSVIEGKSLGDAGQYALLWSTGVFPADNNDETDGATRDVKRVSPGGTLIQVVEMNPGTKSGMHRTASLDYGFVIEGQLELELDNGVTTVLNAGDTIVQRGTIHAWGNPGDSVARVVFILSEAQTVTANGTKLDPVG